MIDDCGLATFRDAVPGASLHSSSISGWSVGMHVQHCCLAMIGICKSLDTSTPPPPHSKFSLLATLVFATGRIPRGRGRSPDPVLPEKDVSPGELRTLLDECEQSLAGARDLDPQAWFSHFAFGVLPRDKAL